MTLKEYFENTSGKGVLATADADGKVDAAIYSVPHVMDDGSLAFIMRDRLTHKNLQANSFAVYLFMENVPHHQGIRIFLKKLREEANSDLIEKMMRRHLTPLEDKAKGAKFLVYFEVERVLPLVGSGDVDITA